jgi:hypothetical protein
MARFDPSDYDDDEISIDSVDEQARRDRDGVSSLRDVEAESGDDEQTTDDFDLDDRAARELGVNLDARDEPEPGLD